MPRKSDLEFKSFINEIGLLIDTRAKTQEINLKAEIRASIEASAKKQEINLKAEIRASEERLIKIMATKQDIKDMATKQDIKDMATKQDIARLEAKIDEVKDLRRLVDELRKRLDKVEVEMQNVKSKY